MQEVFFDREVCGGDEVWVGDGGGDGECEWEVGSEAVYEGCGCHAVWLLVFYGYVSNGLCREMLYGGSPNPSSRDSAGSNLSHLFFSIAAALYTLLSLIIHACTGVMAPRRMPIARASLQAAIEHISSTPGSFSLVDADDGWPFPRDSRSGIHLAILDSSFNPPTFAHQAIISSSYPVQANPYTARLLLYTPKNAAKTPTASDATPLQRLEMMSLLSSSLRSLQASKTQQESIATALIHAPTFVAKASILRSYLVNELNLGQRGEEAELSFLVGMDTLLRIFDPKYYPEGEMRTKLEGFFLPPPRGAGANLVSARRGTTLADREFEENLLKRDDVKPWVENGKVRVLGDGRDGWENVSSTLVRECVRKSDWESVNKLLGEGMSMYIQKEGLYFASN